MIRLADPLILILLIFVPLAVYFSKRTTLSKRGSLRFSNNSLLSGIRTPIRVKLASNMVYLRAISLSLFVIALARPQSTIEQTNINIEGIDISLAVDVSGSMRAMDFEVDGRRVDRLEAVKGVVSDFVKKRPNDRIGMIAFSGFSYTVCPLTLDHEWLEKNLERVQIGMIEDGTAIGSAVTASLNRLKDTETKEKIIILLTDGINNAGNISPLAAAEAASALGIRIYTIGAGTRGLAPYPMKDMFGNTVLKPVEIEIDEELLRKIAETTGGKYFRATDTSSLNNIYDEIDNLEKTPIEETGYSIYEELFMYPLIAGLILLLLEVILSKTLLRRIP